MGGGGQLWVPVAHVLQKLPPFATSANLGERCDLDPSNEWIGFRLGAVHEKTLAPSGCPAERVDCPTSDRCPSSIVLCDGFEFASLCASLFPGLLGKGAQEVQIEGVSLIARLGTELSEHCIDNRLSQAD